MKSLTILGSTGSIGTQALDIVRNRPADFKVLGLSAGKNFELLVDQIKEFKPSFVTILSDKNKTELKSLFPELEVLKDIKELASQKADITLSGIVGIAGLEANLEALKNSKRVAVANKETLVVAGHIVKDYCKKYGSELIPVDSEHAAIHQCLANAKDSEVQEIILSSSGGPFREFSKEDLKNVSLEQALNHPTWKMGPKITIDSSTLMNKALEIIEASVLFELDYDRIKVVIHPQSIVHSAVKFIDGTSLAQMGTPNMCVPIQYALDYPEKKLLAVEDNFDLSEISSLEFFKPDFDKFPALNLAYKVGREGGSMPTAFNAANEAAVELFLGAKIAYLDIYSIIEKSVEAHKPIESPSLEQILSLDKDIKNEIRTAVLV